MEGRVEREKAVSGLRKHVGKGIRAAAEIMREEDNGKI